MLYHEGVFYWYGEPQGRPHAAARNVRASFSLAASLQCLPAAQ